MITQLKGFDRIVVSGAQRSGTTITAAILSDELKMDLHLEEDFDVHDEDKFRSLKGVIQAPAMSHILDQENCVVYVHRPIEEILKSQDRIGWGENLVELSKYGLTEGISAEVKELFWRLQKRFINHPFDINYKDMNYHPYFITDRKDFGVRQWQ